MMSKSTVIFSTFGIVKPLESSISSDMIISLLNDRFKNLNVDASFLKESLKNEEDPEAKAKIRNDIKKLRLEIKALKKAIREHRKTNVEMNVSIIKAKAYIIKLFSSLVEFAKGAIAIYSFVKIIVEVIKYFVHRRAVNNYCLQLD